ncbi:MAG: hypothetical protein BMS9Abin37_2362 [Acidobacteriota bacterium]|nr:MAG: hypothetical protein BMS9Abin37_2362 [Acidobacteriota bacterium]
MGLLALLSACGRGDSDAVEESSSPPSSETYYEGTGTIITIINEDHLKIEHDEIPGFMDAMTMNFEVKDPSLLQDLEPNMDVRFRVAVAERDVHIDQIERGERAGK